MANDLLLFSRLGSKQKYILKMLLNGHHISVVHNMSNMTEEEVLLDEEKSNFYEVPKGVVNSLVKRGILQPRKVYSSIQPEMEIYEIRIKECHLEAVKKEFS